MALATAVRNEPGGWPPAASIRSWAPSLTHVRLALHELEVRNHPGQLEEPVDARVAGHDRQPVAVAAGPEAPAGEEREPGRVHELQPAQVDDQLAGARVQGVPQAPLEQRSAGEVELPGGADVDRVAAALGRAAKGF